jgi:hypothetical protein
VNEVDTVGTVALNELRKFAATLGSADVAVATIYGRSQLDSNSNASLLKVIFIFVV